MNRGDHREAVFHDAHDPELFLATLSEACTKTDWQIHSFCLMSNHFHLVVETRVHSDTAPERGPSSARSAFIARCASKFF
jgi:REP element-mobilizing transposase RayT